MLKSAGRFILYRFVFMKKAPYTKRPLSISEQLARLEERGLLIDEKKKAERYLRTIYAPQIIKYNGENGKS